ncbi:MAG: spore coat U domain-containing protein [Gammaproteobacteria bacterium]
MRVTLPHLACCLILFGLVMPAEAALNCRVQTPTLAFGNYSPGSPQDLDTSADVDVTCQGGRGLVFITLSAGSSGNMENRFMLSGGNTLSYNAYLNAARTVIWGDGSGSTSYILRIMWRPNRQVFEIPVYGRVFAGQNPASGAYSDSLVVTAYF